MAGGAQYVSWIHDHDFVRAVTLLLELDDRDGPVPGRLLAAAFAFEHPAWPGGAEDLVRRVRAR